MAQAQGTRPRAHASSLLRLLSSLFGLKAENDLTLSGMRLCSSSVHYTTLVLNTPSTRRGPVLGVALPALRCTNPAPQGKTQYNQYLLELCLQPATSTSTVSSDVPANPSRNQITVHHCTLGYSTAQYSSASVCGVPLEHEVQRIPSGVVLVLEVHPQTAPVHPKAGKQVSHSGITTAAVRQEYLAANI